ncbi:Uncharacterized Fe-S center protein [Pelotomaculum thermopropionicum SI]|uniref:Uncharacterized Fe-S center protein n=1 Tax=Pelotomaculum thermopropionicum (strain DSM 13744 / JCM 10971 / SI) TaxID=370438 RepID=A5CYX1_PELTS|nr:Uncharacterized Fe-S center protein [Pelotomaculum thermopropionicum SI]
MGKSKVYFTPAGATNWVESTICKAKEMFYVAELDKCIKPGDTVAVKIHIGEWNRTACLRPEFVAAIVEEVQKCGGKPFVTDTTTLTYQLFNNRFDEVNELKGAYRHGFNPNSLGCPVIIADGFIGHDDIRVEIPDGNILKETYIARALASADACINLAHAKGHSITSFGGCIKNFGIGGQSKRGKYITHLAMWGDPADAIGYPLVNKDNCAGKSCKWYKFCEDGCPEGAISFDDKGLNFDFGKCRLCYSCQVTCMFTGESAIGFRDDYFPFAQIAMADAAKGVMSLFDPGKIGYMAYVIDVAPECDCFPWAGTYIVPDVGVLASKDIVAIDTAAVDLIDAAPIMPGSRVDQLGLKPGEDKFKAVNLVTPRIQLKAAQKIGMGTMDYELVTWEPVLSPDTIGKHQPFDRPGTFYLRKLYQKYGHVTKGTGAEPFKRVKLADANWKQFA